MALITGLKISLPTGLDRVEEAVIKQFLTEMHLRPSHLIYSMEHGNLGSHDYLTYSTSLWSCDFSYRKSQTIRVAVGTAPS